MALENIFGAPPEYLTGLLGVDPEKLRKQALTTGLVNTALAFAAQPRNQRYGSVLPYAARALMAGQQGAQGVYQGALQDYQTKQKIEELKRQQAQEAERQAALGGLTDEQKRMFAIGGQQAFNRIFPEAPEPFAPILTKEQSDAYGLPTSAGQRYVYTKTGPQLIEGTQFQPKTREVQQGRTIITQELQPNGTWQEIARGSMDAPRQPTEPSYKVETDASGKVVFIPQKPGMPIVDIAGKPTTYTPKETTKPPTEGERKSATLLKRMEGSLAQLNEAVKTEPSAAKPELLPEALRAASFGLVEAPANIATSANRQKVEAAQLDILDAALTLGTGAAYTREQLQGYRKSYFPQIGDSDATVADKRQRLNNIIEAARIAAGSAAPQQGVGASGSWSIRKKQ